MGYVVGTLFTVAATLFLTVLGWAITGLVVSARLDRECLRHGYPAHSKSWNFTEKYCVKREDQTDIVTPIEELKSEH